MHQVLIVEDDYDLSNITKIQLSHSGYKTDAAYSCADAVSLVKSENYDAILLDVLLPDGTGDELCKVFREYTKCPIIMISCIDDSSTIVSSLKNGGDDYVVKPIKYSELLARLSAQIRRYELYQNDDKACFNKNKSFRILKSFTIDLERHQVIKNNEIIELSAIEYNILMYFVENQNTLLLYDELYKQVWDNDSLGDIRTVMVHISNLRKKIDPEKIGLVETVRSAGYIFCDI